MQKNRRRGVLIWWRVEARPVSVGLDLGGDGKRTAAAVWWSGAWRWKIDGEAAVAAQSFGREREYERRKKKEKLGERERN